MGYTTDFYGAFVCTPPLAPLHQTYLQAFAEIRHVRISAANLQGASDPLRESVGLPVGPEGAYYLGMNEDGEGVEDEVEVQVLDHNRPPTGQPGLWCQWVPTSRVTLQWDGGEKFYWYVEWLTYLVEHFLTPWGYALSGTIRWVGEDPSDLGSIAFEDGAVVVESYEGPVFGEERRSLFEHIMNTSSWRDDAIRWTFEAFDWGDDDAQRMLDAFEEAASGPRMRERVQEFRRGG